MSRAAGACRCLRGEAEQQPERVPVGGDGVGAGPPLADQPLGEERLQSGASERHELRPACSSRARRARAAPGRRAGTSYSDLGITGITPILGLFRCLLLRAREGLWTWADALW